MYTAQGLGSSVLTVDTWDSAACNPKGPRSQIIGVQGPTTINIIVVGP